MAEKEGFEPSIPFWGIHDFQSCALGQLRDFSMSWLRCQPGYNTIFSSFCQLLISVFPAFFRGNLWLTFPRGSNNILQKKRGNADEKNVFIGSSEAAACVCGGFFSCGYPDPARANGGCADILYYFGLFPWKKILYEPAAGLQPVGLYT